MNNKLKPAIIGGVVIGILSIIPFVNWANICCCLWAILGGALASYLYIKNSPVPATAGDGAILGVMAGLVGAIIVVILGIPISLAMSAVMAGVVSSFVESMDPSQRDLVRTSLEGGGTTAGAIMNALMLAVGLLVFSTLGGLLGIPIFEKRKGAVPPPPQNF
ncbi:MAG TPA: hypothetical protein VMS31_05210 [Pyrinomonadaceae bacterium]|nr:hypothetical protein [Pyrinomonadaceae bacterium]